MILSRIVSYTGLSIAALGVLHFSLGIGHELDPRIVEMTSVSTFGLLLFDMGRRESAPKDPSLERFRQDCETPAPKEEDQ